MAVGQSASNDLFLQTDKMICNAIVIKNSQRSRFSRTIESQTMENPLNNPKVIHAISFSSLFFDKQRKKMLFSMMLSLADLIHIYSSIFGLQMCMHVFYFIFIQKKENQALYFQLLNMLIYLLFVYPKKRVSSENSIRLATKYIHSYEPCSITNKMVWAVKCFGLLKRKSNISRNNHFAVIVGASIGPCQRQLMISFTSFSFTHSTPLFVISLIFLSECCSYFRERRKKRHMNYYYVLCFDAMLLLLPDKY